jgi:hypothetical protein
MDLCLEVIPQAVFQVQVVSADPVAPIPLPAAAIHRVEVCRPLPQAVRTAPKAQGDPRAPSPAQGVRQAKPTRTRRSAQVRRPPPRAVKALGPTIITADLPAVKEQKADRLFHEAIRALKANDYEAAHRHLTLAVSFAPSNPRYDLICKKVRRYLQAKAT